jgi:hypothetical protein
MRKALVALAATAALSVSAGAAAYAAGTGASRDMHDRMATTGMPAMDMGSMGMGSMDLGSMGMDPAAMGAMHAEMAAACDAAHTQMGAPAATGEPAPTDPADHAAHHPNS